MSSLVFFGEKKLSRMGIYPTQKNVRKTVQFFKLKGWLTFDDLILQILLLSWLVQEVEEFKKST